MWLFSAVGKCHDFAANCFGKFFDITFGVAIIEAKKHFSEYYLRLHIVKSSKYLQIFRTFGRFLVG